MGYIEKHLIPGETVLYKTRLHTVAVLGPMLIALVLAVAGGVCLYEAAQGGSAGIEGTSAGSVDPKLFSVAGLILLLLAAITVVVGLVKRNSTEMAVTSRRVLIKSGIMSRRTIEMMVSRIESIVITEPFFGRMLGYGSVVIRGTGGTPEPFHLIANPTEFRRHVQEQIEAQHTDLRPGADAAIAAN